jgi:hypothetical protein
MLTATGLSGLHTRGRRLLGQRRGSKNLMWMQLGQKGFGSGVWLHCMCRTGAAQGMSLVAEADQKSIVELNCRLLQEVQSSVTGCSFERHLFERPIEERTR